MLLGPTLPRVELPGLKTLAERYPVFFVDQFGVLHDGRQPYPGAIEALARLKGTGREVVLLSNSGRSGAYNAERLETLGFPRDSYDHFVTSGDVAVAQLRGPAARLPTGPGTRCITISGIGERSLADSLGMKPARDGYDADLVVIAGSRGDVVTLETYARLLEPAALRGVPCICTNPDKLMLTGSGTAFGAGRIADLYTELGGVVTWIGKPYRDIYEQAARLSGVDDPRRVVAIGDSVEHDVVGAKRFGAAAALVRTGIHAALSAEGLTSETRRHGSTPDYVLPGFIW